MCLMYSSSFFKHGLATTAILANNQGVCLVQSAPRSTRLYQAYPERHVGHPWATIYAGLAVSALWENIYLCVLWKHLCLWCVLRVRQSLTSLIWSGIILWILRVWCLKVVSIATWSIRQHPQRIMGKETEIACRWIESSDQQSNNCCWAESSYQRHKHICRQTMFFFAFCVISYES